MKVGRLAVRLQYSAACALIFISGISPRVMAQEDHSHNAATHHETAAAQNGQAGALIQVVRDATARFQHVSDAVAAGYQLQFGCVSGPDSGAMGLHYVNGSLVNSGVIDPRRPQIVIYEPGADGNLNLIGADYLVIASTWDASHTGPPELMGQLFHYFEAPNRFGLPAFYTLHVWAWKDNPNGAFVNWHPDVSCQQFNPTEPR